MTHNEQWMMLALEEAQRAMAADEVPVGAIVVQNNQVIGVGHNMTALHNDPTAHAEIMAIRMAAKTTGAPRLEGCTLYVTLEPCPMCAGAIVQARLHRLVFGAFDSKAGATGTLYSITTDKRLNHTTETFGGVLDKKSAALLKGFFQERRAI